MKKLLFSALCAAFLFTSQALAFYGGTVVTPSGASYTPTAVSCGTTATLLLSASTAYVTRQIENTSGVTVYLGGSSVTSSTSGAWQLLTGWADDWSHYSGALYCAVASGTATVNVKQY